MARTNYLAIFNHYVYSDFDLWPITLDQGHDTFLGPGQQSCEILFKPTKRIRSYGSDGRRTTDAVGQRHNVWRRAHNKKNQSMHWKIVAFIGPWSTFNFVVCKWHSWQDIYRLVCAPYVQKYFGTIYISVEQRWEIFNLNYNIWNRSAWIVKYFTNIVGSNLLKDQSG
jgi:hypothetical protein